MTAAATSPARGRARLAGHLFVLAFLGLWSLYSLTVEAYTMPGPWLVAKRLWQFLTDVHEVKHMLFSFAHIIAAVVLSCLIGSALAFLGHYLGMFRLMVFGRLNPFLNSFSGIGWTFIAIIWFGIGDQTVIFVICMVLIPFAVINMAEGLANLDSEMVEMARSFTRSRWRSFYKVILPLLYPFIFATIRISFGVAWKVTLTAELFGGNTGMGYLINLARTDFDMPLIFTVIAIIIAFVYSTDRFIFAPLQARLARHHGAG